ncbi:hypothetical protein DCCM_3258 [Desulfocucumis palustris]|uniref:Uncharacterized protein n=1 Tax=Desulfocucumis palustris TaxID=1898651 RepID=A0A2L2XIT3_9FIRM|nr:hypothetical protein [Desulfocucumis palustris]GBF34146.1 hypothetical protein DCCM_3258 [Desulfocucumis palustris]
MFSLINNLLNLGLYLLVGIPVAIFLVYILSSIGSNFFGGPLWIWFIGNSVIAFFAINESYNKAKLKQKNGTD